MNKVQIKPAVNNRYARMQKYGEINESKCKNHCLQDILCVHTFRACCNSLCAHNMNTHKHANNNLRPDITDSVSKCRLRKVSDQRCNLGGTPAVTGYSSKDFPSRAPPSYLLLRKDNMSPNNRESSLVG